MLLQLTITRGVIVSCYSDVTARTVTQGVTVSCYSDVTARTVTRGVTGVVIQMLLRGRLHGAYLTMVF